MSRKVTVGIRIQADGISRFAGGQKRVQSSLDRTRKSALSADKGVTTLNATIGRASGLLRTFAGLGVATAFVLAGKSAITSADQFRVLDARIKVATIATNDYKSVSSELFSISQKNGTSLRETIKLFQNLARVAPELDANNEQMLVMLDLVQKVGITSGASFDDMKFAMRQFGQSMASGIVRAEEFNSIVENVPELAFQIAKGMDITVGQLRLAVIEGNVLSTEVFAAINKQGSEINLIFRGFPRSIEQAKTALDAGFGKSISRLNKELAFGTDELVDVLDDLAESLATFAEDDDAVKKLASDLEQLVAIGKVAATTFIAFKASGLIVGGFSALRGHLQLVRAELAAVNGAAISASASIKAASSFSLVGSRQRQGLSGALGARQNNNPRGFGVLANTAQAAPVNKLTTAMRGLSVAGSGALAVMGGWPGLLIAGGIAATTYAVSTSNASDETEDFAKKLLELDGNLKELSLRKLNKQVKDYKEELEEAQKIVKDFSSDNSAFSGLFGRDLSPFVQAKKDVQSLTEIIKKLSGEVAAIDSASADLAKKFGLNVDEEFSQSFLDQLLKIKDAQDKVGKSKRQLALDAISSQGVRAENVQRLKDEVNATYDLIDAEEKSNQLKKEAEAQERKTASARESAIQKSIAFSKSLDNQAESIRQSTAALSLQGSELAVHEALLSSGLLLTRELNAADKIRKQIIIDETLAYVNKKTAIEQMNSALDVELDGIKSSQKAREQVINADIRSALQLRDALKGPMDIYADALSEINRLNKEGRISDVERAQSINRIQQEMVDAASNGEGLKSMFQDLEAAVDGWGSSFADAMVESSGSFTDFADNMIKQLQKIAIQQATQPLFSAFGDLLGGSFGDIFSSASSALPAGGGSIHLSGARASGGPVNGGSAYLVGERGPEVIVPRNNGTVIPNNQLSTANSGGVSVSVHVDASGSSVEGDDQKGNELGGMMGNAIRSVLIQESRPGGLLAS